MVKSVNGLATANIKSINGLAVGSVKSWNGLARPSTTTYATWNSSDKDSHITLSNSDLTATNNEAQWNSVRATISKSSGKRYREIVKSGGAVNCTDIFAGVATSSENLTHTLLGQTNAGWGWNPYNATDGRFYHGGTMTNLTSGIQGAKNNVLGFALDLDNGTLKVYVNNSLAGTIASGVSGTVFPCTNINGNGTNSVTNFGASAMAYTAPSGYSQGFYS